ncbi:DUF4214 domain-containing protein [Aquihabitans sp. McL0605]|uniref:DUF4214 domain-containing protein n=1 Tax=Aquihabitans sp. McL0605 TaxID=3415671 RepID=UPI003CF61121
MHHRDQTTVGRRRARRPVPAVLAVALVASGVLWLDATPASAAPAPLTVTSTGDGADAAPGDGTCATATATCTLRAAIQEADATPGAATVTITFAATGSIRPVTKFPAISRPVTIDGSTAPGYTVAGGPLVRITCDDAPAVADGLTVTAPSTTIRALEIDGCDNALSLPAGADHARIYGNEIGTDGIHRAYPHNGLYGIVAAADDVQIGGPAAGEGNVVNTQEQSIVVKDTTDDHSSNQVTIQGNRVGPKPDGDPVYGIAIEPNVHALVGGTTPGAGNVVAQAAIGIRFTDNGAGITIQGNLLGTDPTGTTAIPNNGGIDGDASSGARAGSAVPLIGGGAPGAGNLISGNRFDAIQLSVAATVQGNLIGTDITGTTALPNGGAGSQDSAIELMSGYSGVATTGTLIGGTGPGEGNVISGNNGRGIQIDQTGYRILGNHIGTDATGTRAIPNGDDNILIDGSSTGPGQIGGVAPGEANTIANSPGSGVHLYQADTPLVGVSMRGNRIFGNDDLSIDLFQHEPDHAANGDQIDPKITSITPGAGAVELAGTVRSDQAGPLLVDVYASDVCPSATHTGEAKEYLGTISVPYPGGNVVKAFTGSVTAPTVGNVVTATTTQATNGTSQFSPCGPIMDLRMSARSNRSVAALGDEVATELEVTNQGSDPVLGLVVPIELPSTESAVAQPVVEPAQGTVTGSSWAVGSLAPGASATLCVRGDVTKTLTTYVDPYGMTRPWPTSFGATIRTPTDGLPDPYRGDDTATGIVTITQQPNGSDPDPTVCGGPGVSVDDASLTRPGSGTAPMTFTVHLSEARPVAVTVSYQTVKGTAVPVDDFTAASGTVTIPAGQVTGTIAIPIVGNQADEIDKAFTLQLTSTTHVAITDGSATGTVQANHLLAGCSAGSSATRRFVCHLYADALGRTPDAGGLGYWAGRLDGGTPRTTIGRAFLTEPEALRRVADRPYVQYIGRHGTSTELQGWAAKYQAGTATAEDTRISVLASRSYWLQATSSKSVFVQHLYRDVFRRAPDAAGVSYWTGRLATISRNKVALQFVSEPEGRRKVVSDIYLRFLRHEATTAQANDWVAQLAKGKTEVDVGIGVTAGSEYFDR